MKLRAASSELTERSASQSTRQLKDEPQAKSAKGNIIFAEFSSTPAPPAVSHAVDIDDLIAELESRSDENAKALVRGRQWVAKQFYSARPGIAQLRLQRGWSQAELARRAGTSQSYIARLEHAKIDPQMSTAIKLAQALDVSIATLADALCQGK